jgi:hypothetical protein
MLLDDAQRDQPLIDLSVCSQVSSTTRKGRTISRPLAVAVP